MSDYDNHPARFAAMLRHMSDTTTIRGSINRRTVLRCADKLDEVGKERDALRDALINLHNAAGIRMMADNPTGDERMAFLNAWKSAGELLEGGAK